jgi:hypothetical protein
MNNPVRTRRPAKKVEAKTKKPLPDKAGDRRYSARFEMVFPVIISSDSFGECNAMARNISSAGILLEINDPLPLGTSVRVHFIFPDSQATIVARGEVKNHYYLNYANKEGPRSLTGMAVRFTEFESSAVDLRTGLERMRILH